PLELLRGRGAELLGAVVEQKPGAVRAVDIATADPGVSGGLGVHHRVRARRRSRYREYQTARIGLLPVLRVHLECGAELLQVREAGGPPRRLAGPREDREENGRE